MLILNDLSIIALLRRICSQGSKYFKEYRNLYNLQNVKYFSLLTEPLLQELFLTTERGTCMWTETPFDSGGKEIPVSWISLFETLNYPHQPQNNTKIGGMLVEFTARAANCFCPKKVLSSWVPTNIASFLTVVTVQDNQKNSMTKGQMNANTQFMMGCDFKVIPMWKFKDLGANSGYFYMWLSSRAKGWKITHQLRI